MNNKKTLSVPDLEKAKTLSVPGSGTSLNDQGTYSLHGVSQYSINVSRDAPGFRGSNDFICKCVFIFELLLVGSSS